MKGTKRFSSVLNIAGLMVAWILVFGFFALAKPKNFPTLDNLGLLARQTTIVSLAALGMTLIIVSGGIDLSVGSVIALVTVVIAMVIKSGQSPLVALLFGLVAGTIAGLLNGALVTKLKVGPFIVTLGTLLIIRGAAKWLAHNQNVYVSKTWLSSLLARLDEKNSWQLLPTGVWLMLLMAVLVAAMMRRTRFGRHIVAVGSNEAAANLCGIPVGRVRLAVYVLAGFFFGLAGLMQFSKLTVGDPTSANGAELDVIAAVVVGGASLSGGQGSIIGSLIGAFIMTTIRAGCAAMGLEDYVQMVVTGAIIVGAVALDKLRVKAAT